MDVLQKALSTTHSEAKARGRESFWLPTGGPRHGFRGYWLDNLQTMGLPNSNTVTDSYPSSQQVTIRPTMLAAWWGQVQGPWLKGLSISILNLWIAEFGCRNLHLAWKTGIICSGKEVSTFSQNW